MEVCVFPVLLVLCVGLNGKYTHAGGVKIGCEDLAVSSEALLVEFGQPAEVNCSITKKQNTAYVLGWESKTPQPQTESETSVVWRVNAMTNWEETDGLKCFLTFTNTRKSCTMDIAVTIYKIPDRVTLSSGSGVWVEGDQIVLRCEIENVAPGRNLTVQWSRAGPDQQNFTHLSVTVFPDLADVWKNVSKTVSLNITARREDDGARYQCAAQLNLNLKQSERRSEPITITVHYKPFLSEDHPLVIESKEQTINCTVEGNPSPHYTWTLPNNTNIINSTSSLNIQKGDMGQYTCRATNHLGNATWSVTVIQCEDLAVSSEALLVKFGQPAEVNCSIANKLNVQYKLGWETITTSPQTESATSVVWRVRAMTNWEETNGLKCFLTLTDTRKSCTRDVALTIYKIPDRVTLSTGSGVWVEGDQIVLRCEIENVAPGRNLTVQWSRAGPDQQNFTHFSVTVFPDLANEWKNVSKTVSLNITARREDDGARYQCAAQLNLNLKQSERRSEPITITVHSANRTLFITLLAVGGTLLVAAITLFLWVSLYYRRTRMGQYILKQLRNHRNNTQFMDHNAEDCGEL